MRFHTRRILLVLSSCLVTYIILVYHLSPSYRVHPYPVGRSGHQSAAIASREQFESVATQEQFEVDRASADDLLVPEHVPNTVFYVFCQQDSFKYHHYMSLLSVIRYLRPDTIVFYHDKDVVNNKPYYEIFYQELKDSNPYFRTERANTSVACDDVGRPKIEFIMKLLRQWGGWYFHETTMITWYTVNMRSYSFIDALDRLSCRGFLMLQRGANDTASLPTQITKEITCSDNQTYISASKDKKPFCINLIDNFWPKDIINLDNDLGRLMRNIFYQNPQIPRPRQDYSELIPNIGHMAWVGGGPMDFLFYLSVLSLLYVAEVDRLYLHGEGPPTGKYWDKIKDHPNLRSVYQKLPGTVYGNPVSDRPHITDIWRIEYMIRYGGIYIDTDSLVVRKLDREERSYDAVASLDWPQWDLPFPEVFNLGVIAGKRNAPFWHLYRDTFTWYIDEDWYFNSLKKPYHVWERHPGLIKIHPHLQVICFENACHPTWVRDFHNQSVSHVTTDSIKDFKKDAFAYHWTFPNPPEFQDEETLRRSNHTLFGKIGNFVLEKAGLL